MRRHLFLAAAGSVLALGGPAAATGIAFPPAGSNSFIQLYEIDSGQSVCQALCSLVSSPTTSVTLPAFNGVNGANFISATGQVGPDAMHSFVSSLSAVEFDLAMNDTYTVHGGSGPFAITATMQANGTASATGLGGFFELVSGAVLLSIGQFDIDPASVPIPEVIPFDGSTRAFQALGLLFSRSPISEPVNLSASYTRVVNPGDVFNVGYELTSTFARGEIDLSHTANISFTLPDGVFLTDSSGAVFGTPPAGGPGVPEPATWSLMIAGLGLAGTALRRRRTALA